VGHSGNVFRTGKRWIAALTLTAILLSGLALWVAGITSRKDDRPFRGKPESEWIAGLRYNDRTQVEEWRAYGEEGVQVLVRGLRRATRPSQRVHRRINQLFPVTLRRWLPAPQPDSTKSTRECTVSLLSDLGVNALGAAEAMIWVVNHDEADSVRQIAMFYFLSNPGDNCLLNQLPAKQKERLLPGLIRALQDVGNAGLRHNASMLFKYYPEDREVVTPVLLKALMDSDSNVRLYSAEALNRVAPDAAKKAGATAMLVAMAQKADDPIAPRAVNALGHSGSQLDLAVPTLVECLGSTNTLIACEAVWALEWAPREFENHSETIVAALSKTAERRDNAGGYARVALAKWKSRLTRDNQAGNEP
jgi:hypothetical protein